MKKLFLLFTVFLFSFFLIAEEAESGGLDRADGQVVREEGKNSEQDKEKNSVVTSEEIRENSAENEQKPDFFYIQPAFGMTLGMGMFFRTGLALDAGFLVGNINKNTNVYLGLDLDLKLMPDYTVEEFPILSFSVLASTVFDIMLVNQPVLKSISVRISFGMDTWLARRKEEHEFAEFKPHIGWGTGFDLVFKNNMVFKFGIDDYVSAFPDIVIGIGYRF